MAVLKTYMVHSVPRAGYGSTESEAQQDAARIVAEIHEQDGLVDVHEHIHKIRDNEYACGLRVHDIIYS